MSETHTKPKHLSRGTGRFSKPTYDQASKIVSKFGGENILANELRIDRTTVYRWQYERPVGQDGLIPAAMVAPIQEAADRLSIVLTDADWAPSRIVYQDAK